ncbi:MAG: PAS domain S-box protein [Planctomyces sp.]|nr:PAS domain S-box protein [Planctomyces sp.]
MPHREYLISESQTSVQDIIGAITGSIPDAMFLKGRDGRYRFCNAAGAEYLGKSLKEIIGATDDELFGAAAEAVLASDQLVMESGTDHSEEIVSQDRGAPRILRIHRSPNRRNDGLIDGVFCAVRDVTEQREAESAIRKLLIGSSLTGSDYFRSLATVLCHVCETDFVFIGEMSEGETEAVQTLVVAQGDELIGNFRFELSETPCVQVIEKSFYHFPEHVSTLFPRIELLRELGIESYMGIALKASDGTTSGLIALLNRKPFSNPGMAESLLRVIASRAAAELERERAERTLRRNLQELTVLNQVGRVCSQATTLDEILQQTTRVITDSLFPDNCGFMILNATEEWLVPHDSFVVSDETVTTHVVFFNQGIIGKTFQTGRVHRLDDIRNDTDYVQTDSRTRSELCVPIRANGRIAGVLNIESAALGAFRDTEEKLVIAVVDLVAAAWERVTASEKQKSSDQLFHTLVNQAADGFFLHDHNGRFLDVNQRACETLGYTREELLTMSVFDIAQDLEFSESDRWWDQFTPGEYVTREGIHWRKNGSTLPVEIRVGCVETSGQRMILALVRDITARKEAERLSRLMHFSIERAVDPVFWVAPDSTILYANDAACRVLGYHRDELIGNTVPGIDPNFPAEAWPDHWNDLKTRGAFKFESDHRTKDGSSIRTEVTVNYLQYEGEEYNCAVMRDITEQNRVAERLRRNEEHLRLAMGAAPLGTWDRNLETGETYWSENLWAILGHSSCDTVLTFETFKEVIHPDDLDRVLNHLEQCVISGGPFRSEFRIIRADGSIGWILEHGQVLLDSNGKATRIVGVSLDLTDRYHAERTLKDSELRFRTLFERCADAIFLLDSKGRVTAGNPAAAVMHGYSEDELTGLTISELDAPSCHNEIPDRLGRLLNGETLRFEIDHRRKDGTIFPVEVVASLLELNGEPLILAFDRDITERRGAADALRKSEERFSKLFYFSPFSIMVASYPDGRILEANDAFLRLLEFESHEVVGKTTVDLGIWENPNDRLVMLESLKTTSRLMNGEFWFRTGRGNRRLLLLSVEIIRIGEQSMSLAMSIDITERRRAQDSLQQSLATLRATLEATADGILVVDLNGRAIDYNRQFLELWNVNSVIEAKSSRSTQAVNASEMQQFADDIVQRMQQHSLDQPGFRNRLKELFDSPEASTFDVLEFDDGRVIERYSQPQRIAGIPTGRVFSFRDVTRRRQAETSLKETAALLQAISAGTTDALFVKDLNGKYLMFNEAACRFVGKPLDSVLGHDDTDLFSPDSVRLIRDRDNAVITSGETITAEETITSAGVTRTYLATKGPYRDHNGDVVGVIGISRDISDQKKLEERIRESQKLEAVGELAGGVAHDFNNLLTIINGYCDLLMSRIPNEDLSYHWVSEIRDAGRRAAQVTQQLLSFSRKAVHAPLVLNLSACVAESERLLRRLIGEHIQLIVSTDPAASPVRADSGQLDQVFMNLAINARDAMPNGGILQISTKRVTAEEIRRISFQNVPSGHYAQITFADSGHGIPPEVLSRVFEPFFTTKEKGKGTGLGLAVVHGIIQQSGGWIHVDSELRMGTTFFIWLPIATAEVGNTSTEGQRSVKLLHSGTILIVEDEPGVRQMIRISLEACGYDILEAEDPNDAMELLREQPCQIDLLVSDIVMPGMNGLGLASILRKDHPRLPVLFMSGYNELEAQDAPVTDDNNGFLPKPFSPDSLIEMCDRLIQNSRTRMGDGAVSSDR